ncbi:DUF4880 domain-containing protein [Pseudomonas sp. LRF_L74]|uniref:DUF4880 domain-containing protein n=1 Tax=Pseudomonas sp. LRF_L74 TaxID=3369422 RepID=UPI003F5F2787
MSTADAEEQRIRQAIAWLVRLQHDNDPALHRQCEQWRRQDARHERIWQRVSGLQSELSHELGALPSGTVATLENSATRLHRRQALKLLSLGAALGGGTWLARDLSIVQPLLADQATSVGERRHLALNDAIALDINTDSALDLHTDAQRQSIDLRRGELFVSSAQDNPLSLGVRTPHGLFEVPAFSEAAFGLRLGEASTSLTVERGQVGIAAIPAFQAVSGQRYRVNAGEVSRQDGNGLDPSAWREGLIVSRDMRLGDFLGEVERYRPGHIGCAADIAELRLSGVFRLSDTDELLNIMAQTLPVRVRYMTRWWVSVQAA